MLAELIVSWREKNRVTIRQLAKIIGLSASALCRFECGKSLSGKAWAKIMVWVLIGEPTKVRK